MGPAGILRNYQRQLKRNRCARVPYVTRPSLTDCYGFRVIHRLVRLPIRRGEYTFIVLNDHTLRTMSGQVPRSLTLKSNSLSICIAKEIADIEPVGAIGIDRNLDNVTTADSGKHPAPRPRKGDGGQGQMQGNEEPLQAKRR